MKNKEPKQTIFHVKTGDLVKIIAGDERNKSGNIISVNRSSSKVFIEGLNMKVKHVKPSAQNPQGGIVQKEAGIHISNVKLVETVKESNPKSKDSKKSTKKTDK